MAIRALQPKGFGRPLGMYSHGMEANGLVVVAGQVGTTPDGGLADPPGRARRGPAAPPAAPAARAPALGAGAVPAMSNVASHFVDRHLAEGRGDAVAVRCEDRTLTYRQLRELVDRTGNALRELGVEREQRVLMVCLDRPEFVGTFWGAIKIGAVPVPVNTLLRAADYLYVLEDSRARVAVVSAPLLAEVGPAL